MTYSDVKVSRAKDYHQPFPDPGEVYQHVNTQLFNQIDEVNRGKNEEEMSAPFNLPPLAPIETEMKGFTNDYINTLLGMKAGKKVKAYQPPTREQFEVIMQCFMPNQVPVLSTLAKEFAVFDHWFCSVPSQTWCNRAFWHAGTSGGFVNNPMEGLTDYWSTSMHDWKEKVYSQPNLFTRMSENNLSSLVYKDQASLTKLVNGLKSLYISDNHGQYDPNHGSLQFFKNDIESGRLPQYSFLEPRFMFKHNDQHPSALGSLLDNLAFGKTHPGTVKLGERLISDVYKTIFENDQYKDNTLLIITYDEHGGCFDHVPPIIVSPPKADIEGQMGFDFKRSGARVPMVMVSSHIQPNTIMNGDFEHTSFLKTMCKKWNLEGFTDRDKNAPSFEQVFSSEKRGSMPTIESPEIKEMDDKLAAEMPLNDLQQSILNASHVLASETLGLGAEESAEKVNSITTIGHAMDYLESIQHHLND